MEKRNRLDYAAFFKPPQGVFGTVGSRLIPFLVKPGIRSAHVKDRDKRNDLVLRTLLKKSQAAIKRGLDLRGGIAFTMEATDLNVSVDLDQASGASPMDKVVEIMSERLNAFGVAETVVRKKGDRAIEVQIPDLTTKQDPGIINELQKPAKLEFRIVNTNSEAPIPLQEGEEWTDEEGFLMSLYCEVMPNQMKDPFGYADCGLLMAKLLQKHIRDRIRWVVGKLVWTLLQKEEKILLI